MKNNSTPNKTIIYSAIVWRVALLVIALLAIRLIPFKPSFPYWETLLEPNGHPLFWGWANFDGVHYLTIAKSGYSAQYTQAFFPVFPLLIRYLNNFLNNNILSGLIISNFLFIGSIMLLYKLVRMDFGDLLAKRTLMYLMLFPTAFFFVSLYSESLFLFLVLLTFYFSRKQMWWKAGMVAALASATRVFGIFLLPALLVEWFQLRNKKKIYSPFKLLLSLMPIFISSIGLFAYMYYLKKNFSDPLLFLNVQPVFGAERSADKIILIYQVFWRYAKMLFTVQPLTLLYYTVVQEVGSGLIFLILSLVSLKKTRLSYAIFGLLAYIAPTLTGTFSSMPRYVLILFPSFILLGSINNRWFHRLWWMVSAILLAVNTALFIRGYWVA